MTLHKSTPICLKMSKCSWEITLRKIRQNLNVRYIGSFFVLVSCKPGRGHLSLDNDTKKYIMLWMPMISSTVSLKRGIRRECAGQPEVLIDDDAEHPLRGGAWPRRRTRQAATQDVLLPRRHREVRHYAVTPRPWPLNIRSALLWWCHERRLQNIDYWIIYTTMLCQYLIFTPRYSLLSFNIGELQSQIAC